MPIVAVAADHENGSATALHPKALAINAPGFTLNAPMAANLAVKADLIGIEVAAVLAVFVLGFAGYGSLGEGKRWHNETCKRYTDEANKGCRFHGSGSLLCNLNPTTPHVRWGPGSGAACERSLAQWKQWRQLEIICLCRRANCFWLLGTGGAAVDPDFHLGHSVRAAEWRESTAIAGIPAPADKFVICNVFEELLQGAAAGLFGVFELPTEFGGRAADEHHFVLGRRQAPLGIARRHVVSGEIGGLVTSFAAHGGNAVAVLAAFYVLQVNVTVVALQRSVACGMAILAARRSENFVDFEKGFCRTRRVGLWVAGCSMQIRNGEDDQRNCKDREYPDQRKVCAGVF
jgi:hypothetical protein